MKSPLRPPFDRYPADLRPLLAPEPLGNAGGASGARLWRFGTINGLLVARLWPEGRSRAEVQAIHNTVRLARPLGFLAVPFNGLDGLSAQEIDGRIWEVAPWMPGEADLSASPSRSRVVAAFGALARVHNLWGPGGPTTFSPGLALRSREIEALPRDLNAWGLAVGRSPQDELASLALRWIGAARALGPKLGPRMRELASLPVRIQPVLRDARPDHFLFTGDRVTGLVDFGAMGLDAVSADLTRLVSEWGGVRGALAGEALAAYESQRPLDPAERRLIGAFDQTTGLLAGGRWIRWHFVEARTFDDPLAVVNGLRRALAKLLELDPHP